MFNLSAKEFSDKYYCKERNHQSNNYYRLDCESGEGLINPLLKELEKNFIKLKKKPAEQRKKAFELYLEFFLKKCININRSFSDAIQFLSIWLKISPDIFLTALKNNELKLFFNRTEYDHDGDKWYFPKLLKILSPLIKQNLTTADELLFNIFETFDFFAEPEIFVSEIIGYDRLEWCIKQSPAVFKQALLSKVQEFVKQYNTIDIGLHSRKYLNDAIQAINGIQTTKIERQTERLELASFLKNNIFSYPSIKNFNSSDSFLAFPRTNYNRSNNY
ncbi:hypothetical protein [Rickettsiella endosymbiont of Rhagonycha lignosa]|uniref:hypothetical protein n=1 Tax=Rickettsiella endosymbiont of Rhagonycha lignosa TaxID=3077937 RepID=UPI00313BE9F8